MLKISMSRAADIVGLEVISKFYLLHSSEGVEVTILRSLN